MIDIEKAEEEFRKYTNKYDKTDFNIELKIHHTFRVEALCEKIARSLGMNEEEINLSKLIGVLHDIARFEQYTRYKTFSDIHSIDHGDLGVKILEEDNYIRRYIENDKYDAIIKKAILNHNKYAIEPNLNKKEEMFCKIIRDADKLDIMYEATCEFWKDDVKNIEKQVVSPEVLEQFLSKQVVNKRYVKYTIDNIIVILAFIYDFNYKESYKIIKENNYIDEIINRFSFEITETKEQMKLIGEIAQKYIQEKIEEE